MRSGEMIEGGEGLLLVKDDGRSKEVEVGGLCQSV